jgi:predicted AAA+ superfamily ATPase
MKICILANISYSNTLYIKYFSYICTIKQNQGRKSNTKAYIIDPGLQNNRDNSFAGENIGWRLENVVYIELLRRCANEYLDIYYYKDTPRSKEVDFVICNQNKAVELIQVSYDIDNKKTFDREVNALLKASAALKCDHLSLIAFSPTRDIEIGGKCIHIYSAIDWLLKEGTE